MGSPELTEIEVASIFCVRDNEEPAVQVSPNYFSIHSSLSFLNEFQHHCSKQDLVL